MALPRIRGNGTGDHDESCHDGVHPLELAPVPHAECLVGHLLKKKLINSLQHRIDGLSFVRSGSNDSVAQE